MFAIIANDKVCPLAFERVIQLVADTSLYILLCGLVSLHDPGKTDVFRGSYTNDGIKIFFQSAFV